VQIPIGTTLAEAEREVLLATLRHCDGNKRRAAAMLGVSVKTIYNKLGHHRGPPSARAATVSRISPALHAAGRSMQRH
jgi:DNA-binding NtrC family response regulator